MTEYVKKVYYDLSAYHENFNFRTKLIDISIAVKMIMYPKFMIVNKTDHDIIIKDQVIMKKKNEFLFNNLDSKKTKFSVKDYKESKPINIDTIGMSGELIMDHNDINNERNQL